MKMMYVFPIVLASYVLFQQPSEAKTLDSDNVVQERLISEAIKYRLKYESLSTNSSSFKNKRINDAFVESVYYNNHVEYQKSMIKLYKYLNAKDELELYLQKYNSQTRNDKCPNSDLIHKCNYTLYRTTEMAKAAKMIQDGYTYEYINETLFDKNYDVKSLKLLKKMIIEKGIN
ncbi:hypothetical protein N5923_03560 [Erwiniaceae bacterium BAC15a-03b]|uniref:Uncharacterized protein n=1 Tax=Winslowiella arboricola TaxID=2978220 RepID=A0A9J6PGU0_9GAMM|nr:hypothetical protein [Winslowiella arboricola]MCU5773510.1 hypothetical protein [Winslowiella arboricola]MCU5776578.1 hypothetical protein [Winslowiella arboricola]